MKISKKWLLIAALVLSIAMATSGTVAYLQDTDEDVNVMVLGNVEIEQIELQRKEGVDDAGLILKDGDLVPFVNGQALYPAFPTPGAENPYTAKQSAPYLYWGPYVTAESDGTDGANGAGNGLFDSSKLTGAMDKFVFVKNTGKSDAYFRTWIALECPEGVNYHGDHVTDDVHLWANFNGNSRYKVTVDEMYATIDDVRYVLFCYTYMNALKPTEIARPSLLQVVLTHNAGNKEMALLGDTYEILTLTQAVQTANFDGLTADKALDVAFGTEHPWKNGSDVLPVTSVATADELVDAIAKGGTIMLTEDIELNDQPIKLNGNVTLDLGGNTLSGKATSSAANYLIDVLAGSEMTLTNGKVTFYATTPDTEWGGEGQPPFPGYANNTINVKGKLTIENATVENTTAPGGASYAIDCYQGADLVINSGKIDGQGKCAIRMFCNSNTLSTNVTVNGGEITGKRGIWVQLPGSNVANVRPVNLTVNGGTITATADDDCAIYSYSYGDSFAGTNITITGGTFNGTVAFGGGAKNTKENVVITGGTFNGDLGRYLENNGWEEIAKP